MIPGDNQRVSNSVIKVTRLIEIVGLLNISSFMDEDDNDTEQMKNIIIVSKSLGFLCLVNGLVMFGDAVNTILGLGQEFRSTLSSLHLKTRGFSKRLWEFST